MELVVVGVVDVVVGVTASQSCVGVSFDSTIDVIVVSVVVVLGEISDVETLEVLVVAGVPLNFVSFFKVDLPPFVSISLGPDQNGKSSLLMELKYLECRLWEIL